MSEIYHISETGEMKVLCPEMPGYDEAESELASASCSPSLASLSDALAAEAIKARDMADLRKDDPEARFYHEGKCFAFAVAATMVRRHQISSP